MAGLSGLEDDLRKFRMWAPWGSAAKQRQCIQPLPLPDGIRPHTALPPSRTLALVEGRTSSAGDLAHDCADHVQRLEQRVAEDRPGRVSAISGSPKC